MKKVIIDTDMGWDDVLSILYLMKSPDIEILGITVTGCGETNLRWGGVIARTLMELGNQKQAKIALGSSTPLKYDHVFPQLFKDDMNDIMGLLGSLNPDITLPIDERPAWKLIADILEESSEDITILSLGGFNNLANMLIHSPSAKISRIKEIYAMAGAVYVDGNISLLNNAKKEWDQGPIYSTNHVAEWNVFVDPDAAKMIFDSKIPLTLIPLDACNYVMLTEDYIDQITAEDPIATLAKGVFEKKTGDSDEGIPVPIFDPLATLVMSGVMENYQSYQCYLSVNVTDRDSDNQCGNTYVVNSGSRKITVVQGVSQRQFSQNYVSVINRTL